MSEETKLNIYQRLNEVRKEVAYLQKDATVQGYKAISHDMVTAAVRPLFIKYGIIMVPRQTASELKPAGKSTSNGTPYTIYEAFYEFDFVNIEDPTDKVTAYIGSVAEDLNDKGPGKAVSYAAKTVLLKILNIETGESDESRIESKPVTISEDQVAEFKKLSEAWQTFLLDTYKKDRLEDLTTEDYKRAKIIFKEAAAKKAKAKRDPGEEG